MGNLIPIILIINLIIIVRWYNIYYKIIFNIDRDGDGHLKYPELRELMISINMMLPEDELEELYKEVIK